ncbi:hypothetical protein NEN81_00980 [Enterobacter asburiae]|uniref:hypothetical protein n=1 Tax=Enterobacter asburiae TaxID=61645 RepID=UPI002DBC618C|nr:hypothetical protein [Enterobacter asburiae]MEB7276925.1 hypothetical protein [Enterobacter asburiae]
MPVDLKNIPEPSVRPAPPKFVRALMVLIILIGLSITLSRLFTGNNNVWFSVIVPTVIIGGVIFVRFINYQVQQLVANSHDMLREKTIIQEVRRGRRALQILFAECCTAHSLCETPFASGSNSLVNNENVFFPQRSWRGEENVRLSQLPRPIKIKEEKHLSLLFTVLAERLAISFSAYPKERPVMVLLDFTSSIPEKKAINLWQQAWQNAGIQQTLNRINSFGAQAVDEWLDHNIRSDALLLVLSWHYAPINTRDSAEAICGVLFGNRLTQETLPSLAILHRPESGEGADEDLRYAITQALDWGPVKSSEIQHLWLSGVEDEMDNYATLIKAIADSDLKNVSQKTGTHNFNDYLGDPGKTGVWLAIVAATQSMQQQRVHHLLICREQQNGKFWNMVVSPTVPDEEREE